jgi:hypothetical protein
MISKFLNEAADVSDDEALRIAEDRQAKRDALYEALWQAVEDNRSDLTYDIVLEVACHFYLDLKSRVGEKR